MQSFISFSRCDLHTLRLILLINFITPFKTVPINYSFQFLRLELEGGGCIINIFLHLLCSI